MLNKANYYNTKIHDKYETMKFIKHAIKSKTKEKAYNG